MKVTGGIVNIFADGKWNWGQIKRAFQLGMKLDFPWLNWTSSFTNIQPLSGGRGGFWKRRAISPWIIEAILQQTSFWKTFSYTICGRQRHYQNCYYCCYLTRRIESLLVTCVHFFRTQSIFWKLWIRLGLVWHRLVEAEPGLQLSN